MMMGSYSDIQLLYVHTVRYVYSRYSSCYKNKKQDCPPVPAPSVSGSVAQKAGSKEIK